jgi:cyclophilin family peptidyl-prolyl cis-trans isomerase/protein-disulfide isomerase
MENRMPNQTNRKLWLTLLLGFTLLLAACQPAVSETAPAATQVESFAATEPPGATVSPEASVPPEATVPMDETETPVNTVETAEAGMACTLISRGDDTTPVSLFRFVEADDHARGPEDAKVTIIEYSDFQCPYCAEFTTVLSQLESEHPDNLRVIFRHFPLDIHDKAMLAAQASEAAALQGKFWEMHDQLFATQTDWAEQSLDEFRDWLAAQAGELGLDTDQFMQDLDSEAVLARVQRDLDEATSLGLPGTPTLVVNGQFYGGPSDYVNLSAIIDLINLEDQQFTECPPTVIDPTHQYRATLKTSKGDVVIELDPLLAPLAVNNFVFLAENGWFDGVTFHRVIPGFVAQAGDPTGTGFGGPGYAFKNEVDPEVTFDQAGLVAMANAGPDSNGSQFFITYGPQEQLNGGYTIFGRVIEGMDVVEALTPRNPAQDPGAPPGDRIINVTIDER